MKEEIGADLDCSLTNNKKAIILCMSCNIERYKNEENIIKKTWGKGIIEGKYENLSLYFYRGGAEQDYLDEENHIIYLKEKDTLDYTGIKTLSCFNFIKQNMPDYDFIIRTNTSTYINIDAIRLFLNHEIEDDVMLGPHLAFNPNSRYVPYLGGHFLIIPKNFIDIFINYHETHIITTGIDDCVLGYILADKYKSKYLNHVKEVDTILDIKKPYYHLLPSSYCIRIKDEANYENNIVNMIGMHMLYKSLVDIINIKPPHGFRTIQTLYGNIPID